MPAGWKLFLEGRDGRSGDGLPVEEVRLGRLVHGKAALPRSALRVQPLHRTSGPVLEPMKVMSPGHPCVLFSLSRHSGMAPAHGT